MLVERFSRRAAAFRFQPSASRAARSTRSRISSLTASQTSSGSSAFSAAAAKASSIFLSRFKSPSWESEDGTELVWNELAHLRTREVGQVIEHAVGRMLRTLRRHGHLEIEHDVEEDDEPEAALCASALSGREPRHTSSPRNGSAGSRRLLRADPAVAKAAHGPRLGRARPSVLRRCDPADRGGHVRFSMSTSACSVTVRWDR
ncbi:hypothetical protein BE04_39610 [Sorangium cellulosum]|uniref:Uncharacterized protein n=1 Tax=Sorangium cellulosum TaxID=56 RepID=A0A150PRY6_SORCE|nr:hypothetical protein BE04_39610 [Sorangium cellulosum]